MKFDMTLVGHIGPMSQLVGVLVGYIRFASEQVSGGDTGLVKISNCLL